MALRALCDSPRRIKPRGPRASQIVLQQSRVSVSCFETFKKRQFMASDLYGSQGQILRWRWPDRRVTSRRNAAVPQRARRPVERALPSLQAVPRPAPCRNALSSGTESTRRTGMCLDEHIWDALARCGSEASQVGVAAPPRPPRRHVTPSPATGPRTQAPGAVTIAHLPPGACGALGCARTHVHV